MLLGVSLAAAVVAIAAMSGAVPSGAAVWSTTAAVVGLSLTGLFAFLSGWATHRRRAEAMYGEWAATREVLAALPDGLFVVGEGRICSVNQRACEMLGFDRGELVDATVPFPFWPPELRHELDAWHAALVCQRDLTGELTFCRRNGERIHVAVAGRRIGADADGDEPKYLVTVRDVSASRRRELRLAALCHRDPHTGLPDHAELERLLGAAVRRATTHQEQLSLVLVELSVGGSASSSVFGRPEALVAVERLRELARADDVIARTGDAELAWVLPETDAHGAVGAVARARMALASLPGVVLTVGICDLAAAGDAITLCAFADRALAEARGQGLGGTAQYAAIAAA